MAGENRPVVYLDTCVLLDWLTHNQGRSDSHNVGGMIAAITNNKMDAVTSVITRLEILESKTDPTMWEAWNRFRGRKNVQVVPFNDRSAIIASKIRDYYQRLKDADSSNKKPPELPDCMHIATAILFDVDRMVTFDGGKRNPGCLSPLDLNGLVANEWSLKIERPQSAMLGLNL